MSLIPKTASAYEYPLLIKNILLAPLANHPEQEIVYKDHSRITYRTFRERVARLASGLLALGVKEGDTVAVMDWDSTRYLECYFAVPMIGAVLHTINVRLSAEQLIYTMAHAEDSVVLLNADFIPLIEAIKGRLDTVKHFILMKDGGEEPASTLKFSAEYESMLAASEPLTEFPEFDENTRATTFYTTGTTGLPKGVYFSHRQLVLHTMAFTATLAANPKQGNLHREDVYMPITPMFHVHAWGIPYIATYLGVKQVYPGRYNPAALAQLVVTEGVTFSHCVPTVLAMILRDPGTAGADFSNWKVVIGGSALPKSLAAEAFHRGIDIYAGYGLSESCPVIAVSQLSSKDLELSESDQLDLRVRAGVPAGLVHLRVVDQDGAELPWDEKSAGEIVLRTPWLTQGYLKDSANSEKLWQGGWLHTQDVAVRCADGAIRITDRLKDVIKVSGEWLSSLELEDIISSHPSVAECAVIARPDEKWGETPLGVVVLKPGLEVSEHRLVAHVKSYVDRGMIPREAVLLRIVFVESIDKTSVGKIDKLTLRKKYAGVK
jgi:fatty-acyl-CoA synthase